MKKKELIEKLKYYGNNAEILFCFGSDNQIKHISNLLNGDILIADSLPIGNCNRCNEYVFKEFQINNYPAFCPNCDENMFDFEITI